MINVHLFGDAKATAHAADAGAKLQALQQAQAMYEKEPNAETRLRLAQALFDLGRFEDALKLFEAAAAVDGDNVQVLYELAFVYKNLKRQEDAKRTFKRVIELDPRSDMGRSAEHELWLIDPTCRPSWMRRG